MKKFACLILGAACLAAVPALAANQDVENAIRDRNDLSTFSHLLEVNGLYDELQDGRDYTIFAPTDDAFARKLPESVYPCVYDGTCRAYALPILRNHFVLGAYQDEDMSHLPGGLESINPGRNVHIGEPSKHDFAVDGNMIIYASSFMSGKLYKIDGVIADPNEIAQLQQPVVMQTTTTTEDDNTCELEDCSDRQPGMVTTTTTTTTVAPPGTMVVAPPPGAVVTAPPSGAMVVTPPPGAVVVAPPGAMPLPAPLVQPPPANQPPPNGSDY